jgi:farnesyl diphosphate synthase
MMSFSDSGKVGTDIEDNKCSWLIVNALKLASPGQRLILESNYGKKDEECVRRVKDVYLELDVLSIFNEYEERVHSELREQIRAVTVVPPVCFSSLLDKIYKRKK